MALSTQESEEDSQYILIATIDNAKNISNVLKAILSKDKELATIFATENGLKVTVEDSKCVQANAFLQAAIFQSYVIREDSVTFKISLSVLQECLTIFGGGSSQGGNPALKICYAGYGSPLLLMLEENGVLTDCSIKTLEPDETLDFNFTSANVINKIIMKSDFPRESDLVESFQCTQTQSNRYKLSLLKPSVKALMVSCKVSIRTDHRGFLSLQYMIRNEDGQISFVEYYCAPDEESAEND
ncbi:cell cycle checkpoint protein RAD1-like isoform X2 [Anneissia japonica]|uniref:cell cycle checkpoint protein RAD1-like isoform X2 n=1 Tax=Anneissia japonica TaxID=1529436 RepID=UPI0014259862|nr:cell cycle checkpoint protein RAD1-like isoform X2 [Anneissia japonica]